MVYGAIQQNGGSIEVSSMHGNGTTFEIYLPQVPAAPEDRSSEPPSLQNGAESILLVEDDGPVQMFTKTVLERFGYQVHAFSDPLQAVAALPQLLPTPRLLITDVVMPGMNGRALSEQVIALCPEIRVLFVSGYTDDVIGHHGVLKDGIEFLPKPYSVDELAQRVREVLDG
jgi:CheY-like chemotaxis protein